MKRKILKTGAITLALSMFCSTGSIAYQGFTINGSRHIVKPTVGCDEYGDTSFYVECR